MTTQNSANITCCIHKSIQWIYSMNAERQQCRVFWGHTHSLARNTIQEHFRIVYAVWFSRANFLDRYHTKEYFTSFQRTFGKTSLFYSTLCSTIRHIRCAFAYFSVTVAVVNDVDDDLVFIQWYHFVPCNNCWMSRFDIFHKSFFC